MFDSRLLSRSWKILICASPRCKGNGEKKSKEGRWTVDGTGFSLNRSVSHASCNQQRMARRRLTGCVLCGQTDATRCEKRGIHRNCLISSTKGDCEVHSVDPGTLRAPAGCRFTVRVRVTSEVRSTRPLFGTRQQLLACIEAKSRQREREGFDQSLLKKLMRNSTLPQRRSGLDPYGHVTMLGFVVTCAWSRRNPRNTIHLTMGGQSWAFLNLMAISSSPMRRTP